MSQIHQEKIWFAKVVKKLPRIRENVVFLLCKTQETKPKRMICESSERTWSDKWYGNRGNDIIANKTQYTWFTTNWLSDSGVCVVYGRHSFALQDRFHSLSLLKAQTNSMKNRHHLSWVRHFHSNWHRWEQTSIFPHLMLVLRS